MRADVPRYHRVSSRFWSDEKSGGWSDGVKLAALYFLTCEHRTLEGIFKLPLPYACADLHWATKSVNRALMTLEESGFLKYDSLTNVLLLRNTLRYQAPENDNQTQSCLRRIRDLPETPLLKEFLILAQTHCYRKGATSAAQAFYQLLAQQLRQRFPELFDTLNLESSSSSSPIPKTESLSSPRAGHDGNGSVSSLGMERSEAQIQRERQEIEEVIKGQSRLVV